MLLWIVVQTCNIHGGNTRVIPLHYIVHHNATLKERISFAVKGVHWGSRGSFTFNVVIPFLYLDIFYHCLHLSWRYLLSYKRLLMKSKPRI